MDTASAASAANASSTSCRRERKHSGSSCASKPRSRVWSLSRHTISSSPATAPTPRCAATLAHAFRPDIDVRHNKYIWLGTHQKFDDAFTFVFEETEHGWIWVHAYQFDADTATFIVECSEPTWRRAGFDRMGQEQTIAACERIFARNLGGQPLMTNARHLRGSAWLNFNRVLCERWSHDNVVLLGDAAATAHFSVGSGTKLALESAIALAQYLHTEPACRRPSDATRTSAARRCFGCRVRRATPPSGSRRSSATSISIPCSSTIRCSPARSASVTKICAHATGPGSKAPRCGSRSRPQVSEPSRARPPMFTPFRLRDLHLKNRVVVSPMAQYRAVNGAPTDWHLVHYAERAKGGAGLVFTEMTCVSPEGRITPGCTGLYAPEHEAGLEAHRRFHPRRDRRQSRHASLGIRVPRARRSSVGK